MTVPTESVTFFFVQVSASFGRQIDHFVLPHVPLGQWPNFGDKRALLLQWFTNFHNTNFIKTPMKQVTRTFSALFIFCLLTFGSLLAQPQTLLTDLKFYLRMDGNLNDVSVNGFHATHNGSWTNDRNGNPNSAIQLTAANMQTISLFNSPDLHPQLPMTVAFDARFDQLGATVFANDFTASIYSGMWVGVDAGGHVHVNFGDGGTTIPNQRRSRTGTTAITTGTWHSYVCVIRTATDMDIYVDCVNDNGTYSGNGGTIFYDTNVGQMGVASIAGSTNGASYMSGAIDRVAFWSRDLTPGDVAKWCNGNMDQLITSVEPKAPAVDFNLFPNPTEDRLTISIGNGDQLETKVKILDLQGRVLQELVTNGQSQLTLDVKGFAKGFYFVRVESNGQTPIAKKFQLI